jgi:hypothetical protein
MPVTRHPPYRSQACGTTALGSCLRSNAETVTSPTSLLLVPCSNRSTLLPAPVCRSRSSEHSSPWPKAFSPRTPPVVGHAVGVIVHHCSFASSILCLRPTSQARTCRAFDLWPSPTGPAVDAAGHPWDLPVSVQRVCVHAPGL